MKNPVLYTSALLLTGIVPLVTGCRSNAQPQVAPIVDGNAASSDPASANLLPVSGGQGYAAAPVTRVAGSQYAAAPQSSSESYPQQAQGNYGTGNSQQNEAYQYNTQQPQNQGAPITGQEYDQYSDLLDSNVPPAPQPPPPLPDNYEQPEAPGPDYLWTPGYWDYASAGYYYVPGVWVAAPYQGALWTPGWWGYGADRYRWHHGYWGRHVGYYGGINYGFGFIGFGYQGGYWNGDHFFYNRAVNRVSPNVVNNYVYERRVSVVNNTFINNSRTSYVGGQGGLHRAPAPQELAAVHEQRTPPMQSQLANRQAAAQNRQQFFNANNGRPAMVAVSRPLAADRVAAPPRAVPAQGFTNGRPEGVQGRPGGVAPNGNVNPQGRPGFEQGRPQQPQANFQQRGQVQAEQQRQQAEQQPQQVQRQPQVQPNVQQRPQQMEQQRAQQEQQRPQVEQQRPQQFEQQRPQQVQPQRPQTEQQRPQMEQQRPQPQVARPAPAPAPRVEAAPRPAPAPVQHMAAPAPAPRPAAAPAPRPAPAPAPHAAPAPAPHAEPAHH